MSEEIFVNDELWHVFCERYEAEHYRKRYSVDREYRFLAKNRLLDIINSLNVSKILEFGCGLGYLFSDTEIDVIGVDIVPGMVNQCSYNDVRLGGYVWDKLGYFQDGTFLTFKDSEFDLIVSLDSISHLTDREFSKHSPDLNKIYDEFSRVAPLQLHSIHRTNSNLMYGQFSFYGYSKFVYECIDGSEEEGCRFLLRNFDM